MTGYYETHGRIIEDGLGVNGEKKYRWIPDPDLDARRARALDAFLEAKRWFEEYKADPKPEA